MSESKKKDKQQRAKDIRRLQLIAKNLLFCACLGYYYWYANRIEHRMRKK